MTLQELQEKRKKECFDCAVYWWAIGFMQEACRAETYIRRCKKGDCIFDKRGRGRMKLKELLQLIDDEVFLTVEDYSTSQEVEGEVGNSIIRRLDGEVTAIRQMDRGQIIITVDFARGEE